MSPKPTSPVPPPLRTPIERFRAISIEEINAALTNEDPRAHGYICDQGRTREDLWRIAANPQMRAIWSDPSFWQIADVCPNNTLYWGSDPASPSPREVPKGAPREGAPAHYPDYLFLFILVLASIEGIATIRSAVATVRDPHTWAEIVYYMDQYVPEDWTRLSELPARSRAKQQRRGTRQTVAAPRKGAKGNAKPLATNHGKNVQHLYPKPACPPPSLWHVHYWLQRLHGVDKKGNLLAPTHDYYGLKDRLLAEFGRASIDQLTKMGLLQSGVRFFVKTPQREQSMGVDGVVFSCSPQAPTSALHSTGLGPARGTKYAITSTRVPGQAVSRVITDFAHIHSDFDGSYPSEADYVMDRIPRIAALTNHGLKTLVVDSAIRGTDVADLQRKHWIAVVNYPHAQSNPDGGAGKRLNPTRREKSYLRCTLTHADPYGFTCEHPVFAVGGELLELVDRGDGTDTVRAVRRVGYKQLGKHTRREYLIIEIDCPRGGTLQHRVALFHTDPTSGDPDYNWGEVCRVFPPGSAEFRYLYGARNDTESRHYDLKRRIKYMPSDRTGQELRILGACMASNALSWQVHLQAQNDPNVLDDTA